MEGGGCEGKGECSHPVSAGMEHVGFLPSRQILLGPSAKRREVFGESHGG